MSLEATDERPDPTPTKENLMQISIKRISYLSMFGFMLVMAVACASTGM